MSHICRFFFAVWLFVAGGAATAADIYCVGGVGAAGNASLINALTLASVRAHQFGSDAVIRIQQRAQPYLLSSAPSWNFNEQPYNGLAVLGGYSDSNCSAAGRVINAQNTTIDIAASDQYNSLSLIGNGDVTVEGIRFISGQNIPVSITSEFSGSANTELKRNIFEVAVILGNYNKDDDVVQRYVVYSNLFKESADCGIIIDQFIDKNTASLYFVNNTIVNNISGICASGEKANIVLYNNIIWSNGQYGIKDRNLSDRPTYTLINNLMQSINLTKNITINQGTLSVDPVFDADTFHLSVAPKSPAIDSGSDSLPAGLSNGADLEGGHRPTGLHVDRGAYESPYNSVSDKIIVNSNSDLANPGQGKTSLRGALIQANQSNLPLTIKFDIPSLDCGSSAQVITLSSMLPDITKSVTIDGYSQDNSRYNTATTGFTAETCIAVVTSVSLASAFHVPNSAGSGVQLKVSGLRMVGFQKAIDLGGGYDHQITGNSFLFKSGYSRNAVDVQVTGPAKARIGGDDVSERNLLASATDTAVLLGSDSNLVIGNLIGPGIEGVFDANAVNGTGVRIVNADNNAVMRNTLSGNQDYGVDAIIGSHGSYIQYNLVGSNDGGTCGLANCGPDDDRSLPNGVAGIHFDATSSQNFVFGNEVAYNPVGVCVASNKIAMIGNRIHDSGVLGVDLDTVGGANACSGVVAPLDNDVSNPPASPNGGQNYPVPLWAGGQDGSGLADGKDHNGFVRGQLPSKDGNFTLYVFASKSCGPQGFGDGEELVGSLKITVNDAGAGNGLENFEVPVASKLVLTGRSMTIQARDDATGNISEFSRCVPFVRDTIGIASDDRIFVDSLESKPVVD